MKRAFFASLAAALALAFPPAHAAGEGTNPAGILESFAGSPAQALKIAFILPQEDSPFASLMRNALDGFTSAASGSPEPVEILLVRPGPADTVSQQLGAAVMAGAMAAVGFLDRREVETLARMPYMPLPVVTLNQVDLDRRIPVQPDPMASAAGAAPSPQPARPPAAAGTGPAGFTPSEALSGQAVTEEPNLFPRTFLMTGLSFDADAAWVAELGIRALPEVTESGKVPKILLVDHNSALEKRISAAFLRELRARGWTPDRFTVDFEDNRSILSFFGINADYREKLLDPDDDPVAYRQQQLRIQVERAKARAEAALKEPPYAAIFLALDSVNASMLRARLPLRSRIWGTPAVNPGDPETDSTAKSLSYDLQQVTFVDSPFALGQPFPYQVGQGVEIPEDQGSRRVFALGADALALARSLAHGEVSAAFDGVLGTVSYSFNISPLLTRHGQAAIIGGGSVLPLSVNAALAFTAGSDPSEVSRLAARSALGEPAAPVSSPDSQPVFETAPAAPEAAPEAAPVPQQESLRPAPETPAEAVPLRSL